LNFSAVHATLHAQPNKQEARLSEYDPSTFRPKLAFSAPPETNVGNGTSAQAQAQAQAQAPAPATPKTSAQVRFDRLELNTILNLYGRKVAAGEWRDYAIDFNRETAVFSVFRHSSQCPLYRIEKNPKLARRQGAYSVITPTGLILKRGHELSRVLEVLDKRVRVVAGH
jgi:Protein of unknown function (DUF2794)